MASLMIRIGTRRSLTSIGSGYNSSSLSYFSTAGITDATEKNAVNTFIVGLKTANLWDRLDRLYLCSPTSLAAALICAKSLVTMTATGTPTFATTGISLNGSSQYLSTVTNLSALSNFVRNSANVTMYTSTAVPGGSPGLPLGATDGSSFIMYYLSGATVTACLNTNSSGSTALATLLGLNSLDRSNSSTLSNYRNGALISAAIHSGGSNGPVALPLFYGARNDGGGPAFNASFVWMGGSLGASMSVAENATYYSLWQAYQTSVVSGGRQV